jgi:hypothetical protein
MSEAEIPCDVFLAHAAFDTPTAEVVVNRLEEAGLVVYRFTIFPNQDDGDSADAQTEEFRSKLAESRAFVALLTRAYLHSPWLPLTVGAARGLSKPIYVLVDSATAGEVPSYLQRFPLLPLSQTQELITAVRSRPPGGKRRSQSKTGT